MNILVTGGAGFIGSHLIEALLKQGNRVVCMDNFDLGCRKQLDRVLEHPFFLLLEEDVSNEENVSYIMKKEKIQMVYHLAANSDIQKSAAQPGIDYKNTFKTTYSILEAMRKTEVKKMFFASTSAVYGEKTEILLTETIGGLRPISYYGAGKLASEAFISAYSYMNDMDITIFRFPNVIGPGLTHGVIFDFIKKLKKNSEKLEILGDGTQKKPYIYISDLLHAIEIISSISLKGVNIYNVGVETATTVREIADMVCRRMNLKQVSYHFTGGNRGWKGDIPSFQYDLQKIYDCGWKPEYTSNEAVWATLESLEW